MSKYIRLLSLVFLCSCASNHPPKKVIIFNQSGQIIDSMQILQPAKIHFSKLLNGDSVGKEFHVMADTTYRRDLFMIGIYSGGSFVRRQFGYFNSELDIPDVTRIVVQKGLQLQELP